MDKSRKILALFAALAFMVAMTAFAFPQGKAKLQPQRLEKTTPIKPVELNKPKIIMERSPLQSAAGMKIFETQVLPLPGEFIQKVVKENNIAAKPLAMKVGAAQMENYQDNEAKFTRLMTDKERGHLMLLPHLEKMSKVKITLLERNLAMRKAQEHLNTLQLIPKDESQVSAKLIVTLNKADIKQGQPAVESGVMQTVLFQRSVGDKPVLGKGSQLFLELGNQGELVGLNRTWNKLAPSAMKPEFRAEKEVYDDIAKLLQSQFQGGVTIQVQKPQLIYYGDDRRYVQPAYSFTAEITGANAVGKAYYAGVVTALKNPPEPVSIPRKESWEPPQQSGQSSPPPAGMAPAVDDDDPTVGRYVVRQDSDDWWHDACDFKQGLIDGHCGGCPAITFGDYYWDEPRLFTTQENSFADRWNITLMEGHGANWLFTTRSNCCDTVNLNAATQPPYGDGTGNMRFLILKGCSIVPSKRDRADWPAPWWRVFKGLRQAIGFRTSMYIDDDICYHFGKHLAQGCRVLDSWFHCTNAGKWYHGGNMGYGCVIMIPGHEGDTIYNTTAAPPATSTGLTCWWQY